MLFASCWKALIACELLETSMLLLLALSKFEQDVESISRKRIVYRRRLGFPPQPASESLECDTGNLSPLLSTKLNSTELQVSVRQTN
jgi:hypothetical protein